MNHIYQHHWLPIPQGKVTLNAGGYLPAAATFPVAPFAMSKYPVTNGEFAAFVEAGGYAVRAWWSDAGWAVKEKQGWIEPRHWQSRDWNGADCPVVGVSWYEAMAFCRWLSAASNETITLPTEPQWQRAAQGEDGRSFPWGNAEPDASRCNWNRSLDETSPVDRYPAGAGPYGVMDMSGNVWEWCRTGWDSSEVECPNGELRVLRGGSWSSDSPISLQTHHRSPLDPNARLAPDYRHHVTVGFRCVRLY